MRSIDQLRPWSGNPRLNPEGQHVSLRDFIDDIIQEDGDKANFMELVRSIIEPMILLIKLLNLVREPEVRSVLTEQEFQDATSHRFPMTILERFFGMARVQQAWGITFDGPNFSFQNRAGFLVAYAQLIRGIVNPTDALKIDTRNVSAATILSLAATT